MQVIDSALNSSPCETQTAPPMIAWGYGPPDQVFGHHGMIYIDIANTQPGRTMFVKELTKWQRVIMVPA